MGRLLEGDRRVSITWGKIKGRVQVGIAASHKDGTVTYEYYVRSVRGPYGSPAWWRKWVAL